MLKKLLINFQIGNMNIIYLVHSKLYVIFGAKKSLLITILAGQSAVAVLWELYFNVKL